ncbi:MAG: T9SS type A sorting domain-containing protein [Flavobacteriaceae bacterium]|nr:T9SS type A sorting domain-containing protein [Flavobacteriaceae bacterium]
MKKTALLLLLSIVTTITFAQNVAIPDANFKAYLVGNTAINTNGDAEIQVTEATAYTGFISCGSKNISDLTGIEDFIALTYLSCSGNQLTSLDVSNNTALTELLFSQNQLTSVDVSNNTALIWLICHSNQLTSLDVSANTALNYLDCKLNQLTSLDLSANTALIDLECRNNQLTSINVSGATALEDLTCEYNPLTSLDVSTNTALTELRCHSNQLTSLNVNGATALTTLNCWANQLPSLDVSGATTLTFLNCNDNQLTSLDVNTTLATLHCTQNLLTSLDVNTALATLNCRQNLLTSLDVNTALTSLRCEYNQLTSLDLSANTGLIFLHCNDNSLEILNLKNGSVIINDYSLNFSNNINLTYICVDENELQQVQAKTDGYGYHFSCSVSSYCSFTPGGTVYMVNLEATLDTSLNGCDSGDNSFPFLQYNINDGATSGVFIGNTTGNSNIPVRTGTYTITPQVENPTYFNVSPSSLTINFPTDTSPYAQDFCVTPNGPFNDLEIVLLPITDAIPGLDTDYQLFYKNKGTTALSGTIDFSFNDDVLDLVSATPSIATQSTGLLSWSYTNLQPFESGVINITLNINTPTDPNFPVNGNDILDLTATINPVSGDETPLDNVSELNQIVINSHDPNDKTCLEGKTIAPSEVGKYVHYVIRFENTGSASAVNIVVKDVIDTAMYDVSTLIPLHGSHEYTTRIKNTNEVEFIFENINLPFDDANNDGFVAFKIKTIPTLVVNDTFENKAEIYFDYNFPIITDTEITTVAVLGVSDYILDSSLKIYPNPTNNFIKISGNNNLESIALYDINGRLLQEVKILGTATEKQIAISQYSSGIYVVKVTSTKGVLIDKIVKE